MLKPSLILDLHAKSPLAESVSLKHSSRIWKGRLQTRLEQPVTALMFERIHIEVDFVAILIRGSQVDDLRMLLHQEIDKKYPGLGK